MNYKPHSYQKYAADWIVDKKSAGIFLDPGLGKTVSTLTAIVDLMYDQFIVDKVLVIAPKKVAEFTWDAEIEKWHHTKYLKVSKVLGPPKKRITALNERADIYIISRDNVVWLVDYYKKTWPFKMVVIDELSSFKNQKSQRFRSLRRVRPFIDRVVGLTGTPAPNSLLDLFPQIYLLDGGKRLGKSVTRYRDKYFNPGKRNGHIVYEWKPKEDALEQITDKISDICFSLQAEDYIKLPDRTDIFEYVELSKKSMDTYKRLARDMVLEFEQGTVAALSSAALQNKLTQLASGAMYDDAGNVVELHTEKLDTLEKIIESIGDSNALVFYNYKFDFERIRERFKKDYVVAELKSEEDLKAWNAGKVEILLAHPASTGYGLNLQSGGNVVIWYGLTWSLELYQQANARLWRQGQKQRVSIYHIACKGTVEEKILKGIEKKDINQNAILERIRAEVIV